MSREITKKVLPAALVAASVIGFGSEQAARADTVSEADADFVKNMLKRAETTHNPMREPAEEKDVQIKSTVEMVEQSLSMENPMHTENEQDDTYGVVVDKVRGRVVKLGFSASGFSEVAQRLQETIDSRTKGLEVEPTKHRGAAKSEPGPTESTTENQSGSGKKEGPWSLSTTVEGAKQYYGGVAGAVFYPKPAFRFMGKVSRTVKDRWEVAFNWWQSFGKGANQETDLGVSVSKNGWFGSFTRFFIRGGDILEIKGGKVVRVSDALTVTPSATLYRGTNKTSPPGGVFARVDFSPKEINLGRGYKFRQGIGVGVDNNPFGLGKGHTGMLFYSPEIAKKVGKSSEFYVGAGFSAPIAGKGNTTRKRTSGGPVVGYRTTWK